MANPYSGFTYSQQQALALQQHMFLEEQRQLASLHREMEQPRVYVSRTAAIAKTTHCPECGEFLEPECMCFIPHGPLSPELAARYEREPLLRGAVTIKPLSRRQADVAFDGLVPEPTGLFSEAIRRRREFDEARFRGRPLDIFGSFVGGSIPHV